MASEPHNQRSRHQGPASPRRPSKWLVAAFGLLGVVAGILSQRRRTRANAAPTEAPITPEDLAIPQQLPPAPLSQGAARKGHESSDANGTWIFAVVGFLLVFGLAIHFILAGLLGSLNRTPNPTDGWHPNQNAITLRALASPSYPRLQLSAPLDLETFRSQQEAELNSYGWINRSSGIVRIPIEQAMNLLLQQGLPVRSGTNKTRTGPSTYQLLQQRSEYREPEIKQ